MVTVNPAEVAAATRDPRFAAANAMAVIVLMRRFGLTKFEFSVDEADDNQACACSFDGRVVKFEFLDGEQDDANARN